MLKSNNTKFYSSEKVLHENVEVKFGFLLGVLPLFHPESVSTFILDRLGNVCRVSLPSRQKENKIQPELVKSGFKTV